jgi:DNA-binding SARP family transcriptional activator
VYSLRQTFRGLDGDIPYIMCAGGTYRFNPAVSMWSDVAEFDRLVSEARRLDGNGDYHGALAAYEEGEAVYRGEFLEGETLSEWAAAERDRLHVVYLATAQRLAELLDRQHEYQRVLAICDRARTREPWNEEIARLEMRASVALGQRTRALTSYRSCVASLADVLDVAPTAATTALYESIVNEGCSV